jgi:hypothetical protein
MIICPPLLPTKLKIRKTQPSALDVKSLAPTILLLAKVPLAVTKKSSFTTFQGLICVDIKKGRVAVENA